MNYKQGSDWRKWDLHVHTPDSIENHFTGDSYEKKWEQFILDLENLPEEFKVLGINDYVFIDGYKKLRNEKTLGRIPNIDTIFPVVEFRIKKFSGHKYFRRVNFHVIFSDNLEPDIIQNQFLNVLQGKYQLSPGLEGVKWNASITKQSIEDLGRKIKTTIPAEELIKYGSDLIEGFNNLNFDEEELINLLKNNSYLQDDYLLAVGKTEWDSLSWNDQSIAEKKDIINKVHFVFISSDNIASYQNARNKLSEKSVNSNLLDCSDAHYNVNSKEKDRIGNCFTWIKADTTFKGLRQALYEFNDRVFVGDIPPSQERVSKFSTRYIKSLDIRKIEDSKMPETWFDNLSEIPLNSSLVAIIGNKGNGKSAITDILGLLGNSHNYREFSFLNSQKFLKPKPYRRADSFEASIKWYSNYKSEYMLLSDEVDYSLSEKVKYLPQSFLEKICSEDVESENFETELKNVVYSHLDESHRFDSSNFDEYIEYRTAEIYKKISNYQAKLEDINSDYANLEYQIHPTYLKNIEDKLKNKSDELKVHRANKPKRIKKPDADKEFKAKQEEITNKLENLQSQLDLVSEEIQNTKKEQRNINQKIVDIENLKKGLEGIEQQLTDFNERFEEIFQAYEIKREDIFSYKVNYSSLNLTLENTKKKQTEIEVKLDLKKETSLTFKHEKLLEEIINTKKELSEPFRIYQKYLEELENWKKREKELLGDKFTEDTIAFYKEKIRFIKEDVDGELKQKNINRYKIVFDILNTKFEIIELYKEAYKPVMNLIEDNKNIMKDYNIEFDATLTLVSFPSKFFYYINQGSKGSFSGKNEGYSKLMNIIEEASFDTFENLKSFIEKIIDKLTYDYREGRDKEIRFIADQLKKDISPIEFYNFIFGLDYLDTTYHLKLGGKDLTELSPGERGALLLIFYLLLDKGEIPLIIDQPEENLDNQSVYNILVQFIKKAKAKRQVIIVTHNPNLAVVCDAEQVIKVNIEKENKNKFNFISGSIENVTINNEIVKILEGTKPAFRNRKLKYENVSPDFSK